MEAVNIAICVHLLVLEHRGPQKALCATVVMEVFLAKAVGGFLSTSTHHVYEVEVEHVLTKSWLKSPERPARKFFNAFGTKPSGIVLKEAMIHIFSQR